MLEQRHEYFLQLNMPDGLVPREFIVEFSLVDVAFEIFYLISELLKSNITIT